jgi:tetrahydromethanopterin S-methyltransferase subunit F
MQTMHPQIRSLGSTVEIIEVRYRKKLVGRGSD